MAAKQAKAKAKDALHPIEQDLRDVLGDRIPERGGDEQEFMVALVKVLGADPSDITDDEYESLSKETKAWAEKAVGGYATGKAVLGFDAVAGNAKKGKAAAAEEEPEEEETAEEAENEEPQATSTEDKEQKMATKSKTTKASKPAKKAVKATEKAAPAKDDPKPKKAAAKPAAKEKPAAKPAKAASRGNGHASDTDRVQRMICEDLDASLGDVMKEVKKHKIELKYVNALYYRIHGTVKILRDLGKMK